MKERWPKLAGTDVKTDRRPDWKDLLEPFGDLFTELDAEVARRISERSYEELSDLLDACNRPTNTNCWWAVYQIAPRVAAAIRLERSRRALARKADAT